MIKTFKQFNERITSGDMKNAIDFRIEKDNAQNPTIQNQKEKPIDDQKNANLKITDIQNQINQLNQQKQNLNQEIINLENAQRDLMPNNPSDPNNAKNQKIFMDTQKAKILNNQNILKGIEEKIKLLQNEISRNKEKYL